MKKNILFFLIVCNLITNLLLARTIHLYPYPSGVFIYCNDTIPNGYAYLIERKDSLQDRWTEVARLTKPASLSDVTVRQMNAPACIRAYHRIVKIQDSIFWRRIQKVNTMETLYPYTTHPLWQYVAGVAWFDELPLKGKYQYRISRINKNHLVQNSITESIEWSKSFFSGQVYPISFKPNEKSTTLEYSLSDTLNTHFIKLVRSKHLDTNLEIISPTVFFSKQNGRWIATLTDHTPAKGITYTYHAIPIDGLGHEGITSEPISVYNMVHPAEIGLFTHFKARQLASLRDIQLTWKLLTKGGVTSLDLYRGESYEGNYSKIASVSPYDTSYIDKAFLKPTKSYYYYFIVNAAYGYSYPSARVPIVIQGIAPNLYPPQYIITSKTGNIVDIRFKKTNTDEHGYYIYRSEGRQGTLHQLSKMIISNDDSLHFMDTLPLLSFNQTYCYGVASVNTSYAISPVSDLMCETIESEVPIVTHVQATLLRNHVIVSWEKPDHEYAPHDYILYRTKLDENDKILENRELSHVPFSYNVFTDSTIKSGYRYRYELTAVSLTQKTVGQKSQWASIFIPSHTPLVPQALAAYFTGSSAVITWDSPIDPTITKINVLRAKARGKYVKVAELDPNQTKFEDNNMELNSTYFYKLVSTNKDQLESEPTEPISVTTK